jgi:chaperone BCS1
MSRPNKNSLLAIAGASPFNALAGTPLLDVLEARAPGFRDLHRFFKRWLKIDITTLAYVLTLFGAITSGISIIRDIGARLWTYTARFFVSTISISGQDTLNEVVLNWVIRHVLPRRQPRILAAQSEESATSLYAYRAFAIKDDTDEVQDKPSLPISYVRSHPTTYI